MAHFLMPWLNSVMPMIGQENEKDRFKGENVNVMLEFVSKHAVQEDNAYAF